MPRSIARRVDALVASGAAPTVRHSQRRAIVDLGGKALMVNGQLTAAGRAYERSTGTQLERPPNWLGEPQIVGRSTYINVAGQQGRRMLSTMRDGREVLTNLGRQWHRENPVERIIHVPIRITGRREDGSTYIRPETTTPLNWTTNLHESDPNFREAMYAFVRVKLGTGYSQSNEEVDILYENTHGDWKISSRRETDGGPSVTLEQPLRAPDGRHSFSPYPECVIHQSFEDSDNCVIHQLSARLNIPPSQLQREFEKIVDELYGIEREGFPFGREGDWDPTFGVTPRMIVSVAKKLRFSVHGFWEARKIIERLQRSPICHVLLVEQPL